MHNSHSSLLASASCGRGYRPGNNILPPQYTSFQGGNVHTILLRKAGLPVPQTNKTFSFWTTLSHTPALFGPHCFWGLHELRVTQTHHTKPKQSIGWQVGNKCTSQLQVSGHPACSSPTNYLGHPVRRAAGVVSATHQHRTMRAPAFTREAQ